MKEDSLMHGAKLMGSGIKTECTGFSSKGIIKSLLSRLQRNSSSGRTGFSSNRAAVTIYWEKDSIFHPGLQMKFFKDKKELSLIRIDEGLSMSPFNDTYHKVDIDCEAVYWKMDEPKVDFQMIKGPGKEGRATFESNNYYRDTRYWKLQGMDEVTHLTWLPTLQTKTTHGRFT